MHLSSLAGTAHVEIAPGTYALPATADLSQVVITDIDTVAQVNLSFIFNYRRIFV
jgi:hypothetical protein